MLKRLTKWIIYLIMSSSLMIGAEIGNLEEAINIAGKQRMFTQRMLKDYAMSGMKNSFGKPEEDLKSIIKHFDSALDSLLAYTQNNKMRKNIKNIRKKWSPIKKILKHKAEKSHVGKLQEDLEKLLKLSDTLTKSFAHSKKASSNHIINISGRQRMLSQRMASLYMLKVWGIKDPKFKKKLEDTMKLFKTSHTTLKASKINTATSKKLLKKVERSFKFFEFMSKSNSKFIPTLIYKKSNDILKNMNSVTELYVTTLSK